MSEIKVKNFGPVQKGYDKNKGFMKIPKVSIFIGNQSTGKSSIAKLISTLTWLEKALFKGDYKAGNVIKYNRLVNKFCAYQGIKNYFSPDTEIIYKGTAFSFFYKNEKLTIEKTASPEKYLLPKIMYVPAERNFLSAVDHPDQLKQLPLPLYTFLEEFERSQAELTEDLSLPINNTEFEFQKQHKIGYIKGKNYKIRLSEASSGIQSLLPVFLVSKNLTQSINKEKDYSRKDISIAEQNKIKKEVAKIISRDDLAEEVKEAAYELLSSKYKNQKFINIVEEIEQNLFPESQKNLLYRLLEFNNSTPKNKLILTTHSPYIINYITLAIKGNSLLEKIKNSSRSTTLKKKLKKIIPLESCIPAKEVLVYQTTEKGTVTKLPTYDGMPSDNNYLNTSLAKTNQTFDQLLDLEDEL